MTVDATGPEHPEVVLMCGVAGAGKTAIALSLEASGYVRLSVDEEVWAANGRFGIDYPASDYAALSLAARLRLRQQLIELVDARAHVVVDFSFWNQAARNEYKEIITEHGGRWRLIYLRVPETELRRRLVERSQRFDANAAFTVDDELLASYLAGFEEPHDEGEQIIDWSAPDPEAC